MAILKNSITEAILHFTANSTTVVVGNNSVSGIALPGQNVSASFIKKIIATTNNQSGYWNVKRGSNVAFVAPTGVYDFQSQVMLLNMDKDASIVLELTGAAAGSIILLVNKESV